MSALERIRGWIEPEWRERIYNGVGLAAVILGGTGLLTDSTVATWSQLVLSLVTLAFAVVHATTPWRQALYAVLAALQPVIGVVWILTDARWVQLLAVAASVLGTQVASGRTPAPYLELLGAAISLRRAPVAPARSWTLSEVEQLRSKETQRSDHYLGAGWDRFAGQRPGAEHRGDESSRGKGEG